MGAFNAHYGREATALFYMHVSDRHGVIPGHSRNAELRDDGGDHPASQLPRDKGRLTRVLAQHHASWTWP